LAGTGQTQIFDAFFAMVKCSLRALKGATRFAIFSLVQAEKDVVLVISCLG
jgi:hypothetical protein